MKVQLLSNRSQTVRASTQGLVNVAWREHREAPEQKMDPRINSASSGRAACPLAAWAPRLLSLRRFCLARFFVRSPTQRLCSRPSLLLFPFPIQLLSLSCLLHLFIIIYHTLLSQF
ncbi:hypothetical protein BJX70DRAFT_7867 [Aspergillus crustosus]